MSGHSNQSNASFGSLTVGGAPVYGAGSGTTVPVVINPTVVALSGTGPFTLTTAQTLSGIVSIPSGASTGAFTLPPAAGAAGTGLVASIPNVQVGSSFTLTVVNLDSTNAHTFTAGTGGTVVGAASIALSTSATFRFVVTAVGTSATYSAYRI